jgi:hypothetical protein
VSVTGHRDGVEKMLETDYWRELLGPGGLARARTNY